MRKIPDTLTDATLIAKLNAISNLMEDKMKQVNQLRDAMKKKDLNAAQLQSLKQISTEIQTLDDQWKSLV
jgi:hypothetical protein